MRTILTLSAVVIVTAACAPRPHYHPVEPAPYLLHVPAPGTDYRYRSGPQGFGRTGPVHARRYYHPGAYDPPPHHYGPAEAYPHPYVEAPYGYAPPPDHGGGYAWSGRRESISGGHAYESREMMTEETWVGGGVIVEREHHREPHRPGPIPHEAAPGYPGPYALAPRGLEPVHPQEPGPRREPPWSDAGPEPFY